MQVIPGFSCSGVAEASEVDGPAVVPSSAAAPAGGAPGASGQFEEAPGVGGWAASAACAAAPVGACGVGAGGGKTSAFSVRSPAPALLAALAGGSAGRGLAPGVDVGGLQIEMNTY